MKSKEELAERIKSLEKESFAKFGYMRGDYLRVISDIQEAEVLSQLKTGAYMYAVATIGNA
jgi:hypothetical protein